MYDAIRAVSELGLPEIKPITIQSNVLDATEALAKANRLPLAGAIDLSSVSPLIALGLDENFRSLMRTLAKPVPVLRVIDGGLH